MTRVGGLLMAARPADANGGPRCADREVLRAKSLESKKCRTTTWDDRRRGAALVRRAPRARKPVNGAAFH